MSGPCVQTSKCRRKCERMSCGLHNYGYYWYEDYARTSTDFVSMSLEGLEIPRSWTDRAL